ncbi:hypothetical protein [Antrihabitans sp. YC2-6]|uniref:hypothetical protein n=1 Tax=Antrihabitans sp. YC2-6 TaxID=2799498 RepID=UPI0018F329B3|nr:hypothetical protein [Antrihabitans sp. YC2-6]MBJ8348576.1 hypothetical protein [Antrihabitans sp. YC2-6]
MAQFKKVAPDKPQVPERFRDGISIVLFARAEYEAFVLQRKFLSAPQVEKQVADIKWVARQRFWNELDEWLLANGYVHHGYAHRAGVHGQMPIRESSQFRWPAHSSK